MKKTYALQVEGLHPDRRLDAIKHEIRKYLRRERGKTLPEGADFWDFDCRFAVPPSAPEPAALARIPAQSSAAPADKGARRMGWDIRHLSRGSQGSDRISTDPV